MLTLAALPALADTATLAPSADTTLIAASPNNNNGAQSYVNSGTTQNYTKNHGLFQFDVAGQLPQAAVINSVSLVFQVTGQPVDGYNASQFDLHRVFVPWGEGNKTFADSRNPGQGAPATAGEATWNQRLNGTAAWGAPGGLAGVDYSTTVSASQVIYRVIDSPYTFGSTPEMVADVQNWLDDPQSNHGWMLIASDESNNFTARRFGSREDANNAPFLFIDYTAVPEPSSWVLLAFGAGGLGLWRGRKTRI